MILFGTPAAEPHLASGFFKEAEAPRGDRFVWAGVQAELSLSWADVTPRAAILDAAPYSAIKGQSAELFLNGAPVGKLVLNDARFRYSISLPAPAQKPGENRLRLRFASAVAPAQADPKSLDRRQLAAAFYALTISGAEDPGLDDALGRDAARPFAFGEAEGVPTLQLMGPAAVHYALRLPAAAQLRFTPALHPAALAAASAASFRVTLQGVASPERELWSRVLTAKEARGRQPEIVLDLPGRAGDLVKLSLHVAGTAPDARFAWGVWWAPRVAGRADPVSLERPDYTAEEQRRVAPLRAALRTANVIFVIFDAARAGRLGAYGYARPTTPELDLIAAEGVVFERATTPAVYTLGAMASIWTSQHPDRHHSEVSFSARLPPDRLTLAQLLGGRGITTAGFVANAVAGASFGFDRGFAEFRETFRDFGSGAAGFGQVVPRWVDAHKDRRFFLYLHYREPHFPYDPPTPFDLRFGPEGPIAKASRSDAAFFTDLNQGRRQPSPGEVEHLGRLYDGNLAYADHELGRLRRALEAALVWDKSVVILAADHGEGLFEHGFIGHNVQLYEESVHVPLIVRLPKGLAPGMGRVRGLVDLLDVAPTIADVFGVPGPNAGPGAFSGRSLLPMLAGAPGKPAVLSRTVWDRPRYSLRDDRFKYIYDTRTGAEELFDLASDPGELRNLTGPEPLRAAYFKQTLHHWIAQLGRRPGSTETAKLTREQCENMKSLGYLDARTPCPEE